MPLTQSEIALALNNLSAIHTLATTNQLSTENKDKMIELIFYSLERWDMSAKAPEDATVTATHEDD